MADARFQANYRTPAEIRRGGAIGNLQVGLEIEAHGIATRLIA